MGESIKIGANVKRIMINDDPNRVITFDPTDVTFAERFYDLLAELDGKFADFQKKGKALNTNVALDADGIPANFKEQLAHVRGLCEYLREKIDHLFGEGTSQTAFEDSLNLEMIGEFLQGVAPFVQDARGKKIGRYLGGSKKGKVMR